MERWDLLPTSELPQPGTGAAGTEGDVQQQNKPGGHIGAALPQPLTPHSCSAAPALLSPCLEEEVWQTHQHCSFAARKHGLVLPSANVFLNRNCGHFVKVNAHS